MAISRFDIRDVLVGMEELNRIKADIKSLLQLIFPYMSDWAQLKVSKARENNDNAFTVEAGDILDISLDDTHLVFRCYDYPGTFLILQLVFKDDLKEKVILEANRHKEGVLNVAPTLRVEELSKWDVIRCFDYVQEMVIELSQKYPSELANEITPFLEAASRKK